MYYHRSRSPSRVSEGRSLSNYSRGLSSYNSFSADLALSSYMPRNRSVQRVLDSEFARPERSRSPMRDYTSSAALSSSFRPLPSTLSVDSSSVLKRRELGLTSSSISDSRSSPINWLGGDDFTLLSKPRSYYDFPSTSSSRYTSYSSTSLRRPRRIDYSDYFIPVLTSRPALNSNYTPRPRAERESAAMPIVRERKLIKFRETANDILGNTKRKISWDLPEEIDSPLINEMRAADGSTNEIDNVRSRDSSLTRYESKEDSPRDRSLSRYDSKDSHSRDGSLTHVSNRRDSGSSTASASRRSSDHSIDRMSPRNLLLLKPPRKSSNIDSNDLGISDDSKLSPVPRKKSIGSLRKSKKHRKSSIETSDERRLKHSIIADKIRRGQDSPDNNSLVDNLITRKSDASASVALHIAKCESELSMQADIIPDVILETQEDRNRRRRRGNVSEEYSEQDKLEENARSRCRSRVRSAQELPSHSQSTVANSDSEAVRPINRMHRKSVKYKMEQPSYNQFSKVSADTQQSSIAFPADYTRDPIKDSRKKSDCNLVTVDNSLDLKLKQNKTSVDSNVIVNNEVSLIDIKEKMNKESNCTDISVDKIAKDKITESKEQVCPDIDLMPSNLKQTKAKKIKKKDGLKGGSKANKANILDTTSNEQKVDLVQPFDTPNKPPVHKDNTIAASSEKSSISKQQSETDSNFIKDLNDNSKKVEITKLPKTIDANTTKETDSKNIPGFFKKSPCANNSDSLISTPDISNSKVKQLKNSNSILEAELNLDKLGISDTKNVDTKLQPGCKYTFVNKSDKLTDNISTNLDLKTTAVINSKTSLGNKYVETDLKTNSKNCNKISAGVEQKASTLQQSSPDNASNKLVSSNIEKDNITSGIDVSKHRPSIGSELKVDFKIDETKICGANGTDSKKQMDSFPSLTNRPKNELESKNVKTNIKTNKWNKISLEEPNSVINENKISSPDKAGVQMKINSQLASAKTNQLFNTSNTGVTANASNDTKTNQLIKIGTSSELKCYSKVDKTEISQNNCPDIGTHIDPKPTSVVAYKHSNTSLKDKLINTDNKNITTHTTLKSSKVTASGSLDADKTSALPQSLKCPDAKPQPGSKFPNILKEKKCDTTDDKTLGSTKSVVVEKDNAKRISEPNESDKLTQLEQNVMRTGFQELDTKKTPIIVGKQLDKTNTTSNSVQLPVKNIKTKPASEFFDTSKTSVFQNSDQGEIVVVCKLPPPFKKESICIEHDIPDNITIDQSLVVSLRKSTKLHVLGKHFEPIGKNKSRAFPTIPNQHAFPVPKEAPKSKIRALTSVNEEPEINAPIFSKPFDQKLKALDGNTNTKIRLKSIPDVIQSSIKINSQNAILENNSNTSTTTSSMNSLNEQSLVLPNIKDSSVSEVINEKSSADLRKPDILNVKRITEEPVNKTHAANKESLVSAKAVEPQVKLNFEKAAILTENKKEVAFDKLPTLPNIKDNSTSVKKSDALLPKTDLPNIKQPNLKNIKSERKPENVEVLSHESEKISAINVSDVKSCHSEIGNKKLSSDLSKPNILRGKEVNKELENKDILCTKESSANVKHSEQKFKLNVLNLDVKIPEQQSKSIVTNSDVKIVEQQSKSKVVNSDGKTPEHTKSKIVNSGVKISEQTKSIANSDVKVPAQQNKSKIFNLEGITPEQTKSKIVNSDVKIPEQHAKSIIAKTEVKLPEQSKVVNSDLKIPEHSKAKTESLNVKLPEQPLKTITTNSDVKLTELKNKPKVVNSDVKILEQQIKSTITNSEGQLPEHQTKSKATNSDAILPEQVAKSKYLISDKSSKKEENFDKVKVSKFKDPEKCTKKADLSVKTSKPTNESSRPYKRSVTTPNVDTLLGSPSSLTNVDISRDEANKSLSSSNISTTLLKANKSLSNNEPLKIVDVENKPAYTKDVKISYSKGKVMDKTDKIIPGQNSQQVAKDLVNQTKNTISSPMHVSDSTSIKETIISKTREYIKIKIENITVKEKGTAVAEIKKENVVESKNKNLECQKPQSSNVVQTSETEKAKISSKILTSKDNSSKALNSNVENTKQSAFKDKPLKDEKLSSMNITPQTILCDKKDKSLKLNRNSKELIKDKSVEKVGSSNEKEKTLKPSAIEPLNSGNILTKTKNEACLKADKPPNFVEKTVTPPNSSNTLNSKANKVNDLCDVNTSKLNTAANADRAKPVPSNSLANTNSISNKPTNEMTKVSISPKNKTPEIKRTVEKDVNGNSPGAMQVMSGVANSSVNENISVCDTKTVGGHNKVETGAKEIAGNSNVGTSKTKTLANNSSATIPVDPSAINENIRVAKPTIPPPEVLNSAKASATDITKPKEPEKNPKLTKVKPPPAPAPRQWGLCFRYHETIRESSSSDDSDESESEISSGSSYSSETETTRGNARYRQDVTRKNLLDNECNIACHQKCEKLMPNLCGVNQKLLSEVLETVKKGKTSPDRQEKIRTQLSNASISTTVTNVSVSSYDDSPKKLPIVPQKLKFRQYSIDDFVFLKLLGKGSFGKVLLAELKDHGMHFAIKCLKKDVVLEDDDVESTMIERKILRLGTQHPYMCKLYCTFQTKSYLFFVMEYLNGGDLMFHIQQKSPFDVKRAMFYGAEIVSALKFLHKRGIIYRDIKLDNVMLDVDGHIRLVDFGMCHCRMYSEDCMPSNYCGTPTYIAPEHFKVVTAWPLGHWSFDGQARLKNKTDHLLLEHRISHEDPEDIKLDNILLDLEGHVHLVDFGMCKTEMLQNKTSTFCGTPDYIPPEIILGKRYNQSVDWWSFGILLFEMLAGRSPFVGTDEDELFWSICNEEPFYPRFLPKDAKHILENLLIKTPNDRLGMPTSLAGNVEDHPFFSTINWDKLEKKQIPPPFKPTVLSASDTGNFDRSFTMDSPTLSPVDSDILESMDQEQFQGFSYTNPHITG